MKKLIIKVFTTVLFISSITSCEDKLDLGAQGEIDSDIAFTNIEELQLGLNGVYARFFPENEIAFNSIGSDNTALGVANGGFGATLHNWIITPSLGETTSIWSSYYGLINSANRVIEAASNIVPEDLNEQTEYDNILGQLYGLRADAHLRLLSYYTENYQDNNLSIFKLDYVPGIGETLPRLTNGEIYEFINSDLNLAESLISETNNIYVTADYFTGVRARMATLRGDSQLAMSYAQELIDNYPLADKIAYAEMFVDDTNDTEVIYRLKNLPGEFRVSEEWYFLNNNNVKFKASSTLADLVNSQDVRRDILFNFSGNNGGPSDPSQNLYLINKYSGRPGTPYLNDIKVMRVSEMYLIKAEAQALLNDFDGAALTLKTLRDARLGTSTTQDSYANLNEAITSILNERRVELAFEGFRYLDVKRLGPIINKGFERNPIDCSSSSTCDLSITDFRFTLPLPLAEINVQPSLTQNTGY